MKRHAAPIIAAVLLLLPVLYVGSYLALVRPSGAPRVILISGTTRFQISGNNYRFASKELAKLFWPLEQIDRKVRPGAWETNRERLLRRYGNGKALSN